MARLRFLAVAVLALALAGNSTQMGRTQSQSLPAMATTTKPTAVEHSCVIYSLTEMGYDADLGQWISQTIPEMIEPNSWQQQGGSGVVRYYAPKNILIVKQSPAIQSKVDGFMKELKTSLPKASAMRPASKSPPHASVVPADYLEPALLRTSHPAPEPSSYPVPAAVKPPKHLFHFIIRYEGEGIIDNNVVKFMKVQGQSEKASAGPADAPAVSPAVSGSPSTNSYSQASEGSSLRPPVSETPSTPTPSRYAAPASPVPYSAPTPSAAPEQPSTAPKKKKGKKDEHKDKSIPTVAS